MTNEQIRDLFLAVDSNDVDTLKAVFNSDIILVFGNQDPIQGREAVLEAFSNTSNLFNAIHHNIIAVWTGVWKQGEVRSVECIANYTRKDNKTVSLPVTSTLRLNQEGQIADYRIFMDSSPAFA